MNLRKTYSGDIPPKATEITYCASSMFRDALNQLISTFLITFITFSGLLDYNPANISIYLSQLGVISLVMILCRIWDGINDPFMGWIIEKFHFRGGKYKPWIFLGAIFSFAVVITLFFAKPRGWHFVILFSIFYFLWDFAWTINDIAYWSMLPSLTRDQKRRNNLTSSMQIFISIGVFILCACVTLLVGNVSIGLSARKTYQIIALVVSITFLLSQIAICLICKEHVRDEELERKEKAAIRIKDMFYLYKKNDQFRFNIIAVLLHYIASNLLIGFSMYYCYLTYGYGNGNGARGGSVSFIITFVYAFGSFVSQILYPIISKKLNRKQLFKIAITSLVFGYIMFFFTGFPIFSNKQIAKGQLEVLLYIFSFFIAIGQGLISIILVIQMQSTIEYNEWKYGERKEAIVSSMRALTAKWGSAIQTGIVYLTLFITGLFALTHTISNYEYISNASNTSNPLENPDVADAYLKMQESLSSSTRGNMIGLSIAMIILPMVLYLICYFISTRLFVIDEKMYDSICKDLDKKEQSLNSNNAQNI